MNVYVYCRETLKQSVLCSFVLQMLSKLSEMPQHPDPVVSSKFLSGVGTVDELQSSKRGRSRW